MKTKYSPGPWRTGQAGDYLGVNAIFDADGFIVADASDRSSHAKGNQRKANAALIAAAPELLAALQPLIEFAVKLDDDAKVSGEHDAIVRARAAISKARQGGFSRLGFLASLVAVAYIGAAGAAFVRHVVNVTHTEERPCVTDSECFVQCSRDKGRACSEEEVFGAPYTLGGEEVSQ